MSTPPVAIITGAGSGIGRATATLLASRGFAIVLAGRNEAALRATCIEIESLTRALVVPTDMSIESEVERLIDRAAEHFGRIDVLVNNAGSGKHIAIARTTASLVRECMITNAIGPAIAVLRAWPIFERQRSGCIVNVSSMSTIDPFPGFFAYAASKAPLNLMVDSIAKEGAAIGVTAYCVAPGAVETPLLRRTFDENTVPKEMCLTPEDVARVIDDCAAGKRPADNGRTVAIVRLREGVKVWTVPHHGLDQGFEVNSPR